MRRVFSVSLGPAYEPTTPKEEPREGGATYTW